MLVSLGELKTNRSDGVLMLCEKQKIADFLENFLVRRPIERWPRGCS